MICPKCRRNQAISLKLDPQTCRAALGGFTTQDRAAEAKLDCWRTRMHTFALHAGLRAQVEMVDMLIVREDAALRPIVVVEYEQPIPQRPEYTSKVDQPIAYTVHVYVYVDGVEYRLSVRFTVEDPLPNVAIRLYAMLDELAIKIMRRSFTWAS